MPFNVARRIASRQLARPLLSPSGAATTSRAGFLHRTYASAPESTSNQPPHSDSPQEGDVKSSRATDNSTSPDTPRPGSGPSDVSAGQGQDEEGGDPAKQDKNKPKQEKAEQTEKQGNTPLDPADK